MTTIQDEKEARKSGADSVIPKEKAGLRASNNRYFVIIVLLLLGHFFQGWISARAFSKAQVNTQLMYVKMYPDGTWHVDDVKPGDEQVYFRSTIDSIFEQYVTNRYGQLPETIKRNYAEAIVIMSDAMATEFTSGGEKGFNAVQRAVDINADKNADRIDVTWGFADHYDRVPAMFKKKPGEVIRSNIYFTTTQKSANGMLRKNGVHKQILRVQWRLLPLEELQRKKPEWLRVNPIGLEIIDADLIDDPAGNDIAAEVQAQ
ncbi:hypothetical protein DM819_06115 [Pseudomonas hunanensis]|uniref:Conjugal transfer protein n=1 Tax=Pseudomonas hunanensis TaxID=1247546 RepID=A0ABD6MWY7_9PSED|nr:hypothetical protein [Pseudomonas hunanensis]ALG88776.1 Type IV secretion system protein virB8 [uncultured bacterium]NWL45458.1 hypothetical protein [Pseudomonas hunanensis]